MHDSALSYTNIPTAEISFRIPFQQYMTWLCPWRVHFWPNYAWIMQKFFLSTHESAWAPSTNIPTTEISIKIPFQRYKTSLCPRRFDFLPNYALIMQNFILIMHESASAPFKNIPTTEISFKIPFQRYMTWLCPQRFDFWPNYALIMQSFILIMHESASAPSTNIPTTEISF